MVADSAAISVEDIEVKFGNFRALKGVSLQVQPGEVVGLLGENGAGKSTLIKVLAGVNTPSQGRVLLHGKEISFDSPKHAIDSGISTVHQHSMLVGTMTVAENLVLGDEPPSRLRGFVGRDSTIAHASQIAAGLGFDLPYLNDRVETLSLPQKQVVEIVRAASKATALLILDEPTAALEPSDVDLLFDAIRQVKERGVPVLYISHRLDEIPRVCDRAVVLRDGAKVGELPREECTNANIVPMIAGRPVGELFPQMPFATDDILLELKDFAPAIRGFQGESFSLRRGEVLGLTGGTGAGQRDFARALAGAVGSTGTLQIEGNRVRPGSVPAAVANGICYVSGDRAEGIFPIEPTWRNTAVGSWPRLTNALGFISKNAERRLGKETAESFKVRASGYDGPISELSGGNQQKALIARWAAIKPKLMILDEPTLGVDVGSRREIYDLLVELVADGMAIVIVSADFPELRGIASSLKVFSRNRIVETLDIEDATDAAIMSAREAL